MIRCVVRLSSITEDESRIDPREAVRREEDNERVMGRVLPALLGVLVLRRPLLLLEEDDDEDPPVGFRLDDDDRGVKRGPSVRAFAAISPRFCSRLKVGEYVIQSQRVG